MNNKFLTTFQIAGYCQVTHRTVQQWIAAGRLKSFRTPGQHNRVALNDFLFFLKEYRMPIPLELAHGERKKILIVDDDKTTVAIFKSILHKAGYVTEDASDGFEAGQKFSEFMPDLITLDIRMPKLDGFGALQLIRSHNRGKEVKIIVISGITDVTEQEKILAKGADRFIQKPLENKVLLSLVDDLIGNGKK